MTKMILIGGLWTDASVWDAVVPELTARGVEAVPATLPGQGDGEREATLDGQVAAAVAAVDSAGDPVTVVGHSAACTLAWLAADARPERVDRVVLIGGMPNEDGSLYADYFEPQDGVVAFPGWEPFAGLDSDDLSAEQKLVFAGDAVTVPEAVTRGTVRLTDERRYDIPVVMVCPEYSAEDAKAWVDAGDVPELAKASSVTYVDIDSGHWPMISKPVELAELLAGLA